MEEPRIRANRLNRDSLWRRLTGRETLRRVSANSTWLALDHFLRLCVAFLVGAWVARHLGPDQFGLLSFALAFCAPFSVLVSLGLNAIAVRDLVREPGAAGEILGTVALLKLAGGTTALITCGAIAALAASIDQRAFTLVLITIGGTVFQSADVFDLWFQSQGKSRISAWVRSGASLTTNAARITMILCDAPLPWFAASFVIELALCALGWGTLYQRGSSAISWHFRRRRARRLLLACWPLAIAGLALQVQAYSDQILLATLRDPTEVGHYAAALRLVAIFGFIPTVVQIAVAPEITRAHIADRGLFLRRLRDLYRLVIAAFVMVALPLILIPGFFVQIVFGTGYGPAAALLPLLTLRLLLTNLGVIRGLHHTNEGVLTFAMVTALIGAAVNIGLNLVLIPRWGALGCVVSALISFSITTIGLECFQPKARINLRVMVSAVTFRPLPS